MGISYTLYCSGFLQHTLVNRSHISHVEHDSGRQDGYPRQFFYDVAQLSSYTGLRTSKPASLTVIAGLGQYSLSGSRSTLYDAMAYDEFLCSSRFCGRVVGYEMHDSPCLHKSHKLILFTCRITSFYFPEHATSRLTNRSRT